MITQKIAVITTGGTIGSVISGQTVGVSKNLDVLQKRIQKAADEVDAELESFSPLNKNSDDFEPADWLLIMKQVKACYDHGFRKIVITHGTDTLHYTATALAIMPALTDAKICMTGAFYAPEFPKSDALLNLTAAMACVSSREITPGLYVAFRQDADNRRAVILDGLDVKQMQADHGAYESLYDRRIALYEDALGIVPDKDSRLRIMAKPPLTWEDLDGLDFKTAQNEVLLLKAYPGLTAGQLKQMGEQADILIFEGYHSGTAPSLPGTSPILAFLKNKRSLQGVMIAPFPARFIDMPYVTTRRLVDAGAWVYKDLQPHQLYIYALFARAKGWPLSNIVQALGAHALKA